MKLSIIHLSDIHITEELFTPAELFKKVPNALLSLGYMPEIIVLAISGDIAYSGTKEEYIAAAKLIKETTETIEELFSECEIHIIAVPGNHDCDFRDDNQARRHLIEQMNDGEDSLLQDESIIDVCCSPQEHFFNFLNEVADNDKLAFSSKLYYEYNIVKSNYSILFKCYNTAWQSKKKELPGRITFPTEHSKSKESKTGRTLVCSLLHHPFNWLNSISSRDLRDHVEGSSDIIFTGHEHLPAQSLKQDLSGGNVNLYEAGIFYNEGFEPSDSTLHVTNIDLESQEHEVYKLSYDGSNFIPNQLRDWTTFLKNSGITRNELSILNEFNEYLSDPDVSLIHPNLQRVFLGDIFIFPDLRVVNERDHSKSDIGEFIRSSRVKDTLFSNTCSIIAGNDKSGKTALTKILFRLSCRRGQSPLLLNGAEIRSAQLKDTCKLSRKIATKIYDIKNPEQYMQLDKSARVLIIDDFHQAKLDAKNKHQFLREALTFFNQILVIGDELLLLEETLGFKRLHADKSVADIYKISEFGPRLRHRLLKNYYTLGTQADEPEELFEKRVNHAEKTIQSVIGKGIVPSNPLFLLSMLQCIDSESPTNGSSGAYGFYYEYLILRSLKESRERSIKNETKQTYLSEFAGYLYYNHRESLSCSTSDYSIFHDHYCKTYSRKISESLITEDLKKINLFRIKHEEVSFRYKYQYYYFLARHLVDNRTVSNLVYF